MKGIVVALLLLLVLAASGNSQVPDDKLIVPGVRIGKWTLAMTVDDLARMNGGPGIRIPLMAGETDNADLARDVIRLLWETVYAATVDEKTVYHLAITRLNQGADSYETAKGISFKSTRAQVLEAYGEPTAETKPSAGEIRLIYDKIGIWFRFDPGARMRSLSVFRPGTAKDIWKF